jgi:hypothetical protein
MAATLLLALISLAELLSVGWLIVTAATVFVVVLALWRLVPRREE